MAGVRRPGPGARAQLLTRGCLVNQTLFDLVAAAATAELLHAMSETVSARGKVKRLDAYIRNVPYKDWVPVSVNTRLGVVAFAGTGFVVLFGASYLVVSLLDLHGETALCHVLAVVLLTYLGSLIGFDRFHSEIGAVTRQFKKP